MSPPAASRLPWEAVAALSVTQIVAWGAQYYAIAVLAPAIAAAEGWSREAIFGACSLALLAQGIASFPSGRLIDRYGGRIVMSAGSLLSALALAALALAPDIWSFGAAWIVTGVAMAATQYEPAFATLTAGFGSDARRAITWLHLRRRSRLHRRLAGHGGGPACARLARRLSGLERGDRRALPSPASMASAAGARRGAAENRPSARAGAPLPGLLAGRVRAPPRAASCSR